MKPEDLNYEEDIKIDETALDVEWLDQPQIALKYGKLVTNLERTVKKLRERKKTIRSELILEANENPQEIFDKKRPNKADIEAYYRTDEKYKNIVEELHDAEYELEYSKIAKNEISYTRKQALENLVRLHGQQYFSGPNVNRDLEKEVKKREKQMKQNISSKLNDKKFRRKK